MLELRLYHNARWYNPELNRHLESHEHCLCKPISECLNVGKGSPKPPSLLSPLISQIYIPSPALHPPILPAYNSFIKLQEIIIVYRFKKKVWRIRPKKVMVKFQKCIAKRGLANIWHTYPCKEGIEWATPSASANHKCHKHLKPPTEDQPTSMWAHPLHPTTVTEHKTHKTKPKEKCFHTRAQKTT